MQSDHPIAVMRSWVQAFGPRDAIVLQQLAWHLDHGYEVSRRKLVEITGLTAKQVKTSTTKLVELGVVIAEEVGAASDRTLVFDIDRDQLENRTTPSPAQMGQGVGPNGPLRAAQMGRSSVLQIEVDKEKLPRTKYSDSYNAFWRDWCDWWKQPGMKTSGKGNKKQSATQWKKLTAEDRKAAHEAVGDYMRSTGGFPVHCERYLRDRRWEDDLTPAPTKSQPATLADYSPNEEALAALAAQLDTTGRR